MGLSVDHNGALPKTEVDAPTYPVCAYDPIPTCSADLVLCKLPCSQSRSSSKGVGLFCWSLLATTCVIIDTVQLRRLNERSSS